MSFMNVVSAQHVFTEWTVEVMLCSFLTRIAAVVIGVTVESVELCGDWGCVAHQQENEAHSRHFGAWQKCAQYHLQRVSIAMPSFLDSMSEDGFYVKMKCWENKAALPPRLLLAASITVVQPPPSRSPNPSSTVPSAPFTACVDPLPNPF